MVTLNPRHHLQITRLDGSLATVKVITSAEVKMSRETAYDTCDIEFPNHKVFTLDVFNEGDLVGLMLGYRNAIPLTPVFIGEIKEIKPGLPLKISCESKGSKTLQGEINKVYAESTWKEIASDAIVEAGLTPILAETEPEARPRENFTVSKRTPAQVLNYAAKATKWNWYLIPGTDECWFGPYDQEHAGETANYRFIVGRNIFSDKCELIYRSQEKRIKKVKVILTDSQWQADTVIGEYEGEGYEPGDYILTVKEQDPNPTVEKADEIAYARYLESARTGFEGKFTAVGNPHIQQGSRIAISDPKHDIPQGAGSLSSQQGCYQDSNEFKYRHATVDTVTHKFGNGEYLMEVKIAGAYSDE